MPGASWVFPLDTLDSLGAFLAVEMNGEALARDHGAPVRLGVPGWYGCAWVKWVDEIRLVGPDEPASSQMREFAARTHQPGEPDLARDYLPATIDLAATAVRVEKRRLDGRIYYRVVGIVWGGDRPVDRMRIRFGARDQSRPMQICPAPTTHRSWSLWEYRWQPPAPGVYGIALTADDPSIRTRRLDLSFYVRLVRVDEI
jgi:DMSO/TMAO reductase YedYZ molybdopterin-dependent catalytic subunit